MNNFKKNLEFSAIISSFEAFLNNNFGFRISEEVYNNNKTGHSYI